MNIFQAFSVKNNIQHQFSDMSLEFSTKQKIFILYFLLNVPKGTYYQSYRYSKYRYFFNFQFKPIPQNFLAKPIFILVI